MAELRVLFRVPRREWADSAIEELAEEGCRAEVLQGPDCEGCWTLLVTGPEDEVRSIRDALGAHATPFCWEAFLG